MSIGLEILKGQETSLIGHSLNNGRLYFCTDTGNVFLDTNNENENDVSRLQINANRAYYIKSKNETLYIDENFISLGRKNENPGDYSIAVGLTTSARGESSAALGRETLAIGNNSLAIGCKSEAHGDSSFASGFYTAAIGMGSHTEGDHTSAAGNYSHAEGQRTKAPETAAHAEGFNTLARAYAHAEGYSTQAEEGAHAEGRFSAAEGKYSHAEGGNLAKNGSELNAYTFSSAISGIFMNYTLPNGGTQAQGIHSHAEGIQTLSYGYGSHTEGMQTVAKGECAHAGGFQSSAKGNYSFATGSNVITNADNQTALGKFNIADTTSALIIGNGSSEERSNAYQIDWNGNSSQKGSLQIGSYFILGDASHGYDLPETGIENQLFFQAVAGNELTTGNYEEYLPLDFIIHDTFIPSSAISQVEIPSKLQMFNLEDFSLYADGLLLTQGLYYYFDSNYNTYFDFIVKPDVVLEYVINTSENKEEMDKMLGRMGF